MTAAPCILAHRETPANILGLRNMAAPRPAIQAKDATHSYLRGSTSSCPTPLHRAACKVRRATGLQDTYSSTDKKRIGNDLEVTWKPTTSARAIAPFSTH